jgi:prenylcysteine oxidase/farnesylcysteine lyase|uniref:Prenylcysteine lyase domain-containing protein n=1 Tax=Phaeodactylum tricornutum TaxID=2850 RepID=A0A8J9SMX8_PHATR
MMFQTTLLLTSALIFPGGIGAQNIAIIGGGISGSFASKYLVSYDVNCSIDSISIFEAMPATRSANVTIAPSDDWQGSRVSSVRLRDGSVVELGASIGYEGFHLILDMIRGDSSIKLGKPYNIGTSEVDKRIRDGLGIFNGHGEWNLLTSREFKIISKLKLLWRYNYDLVKLSKFCRQALKKFADVPSLLASLEPNTFFASPDALWDALGLKKAVHSSFDDLLDALALPSEVPWYKRYIPYQGSLRSELLTAINLVNYNQDNSQVNGIVGLGSFAATTGSLFSVEGGNHKIIQSATNQAISISLQQCDGKAQVQQVPKRVSTVVGGSATSFSLFSGQEKLGNFDIVVIAAPLQQAQIEFMVQSNFDKAVLQPMPLTELVDPDLRETKDGHAALPIRLPDSAFRPYTQVVTTVLANATISEEHFNLSQEQLPRSVYTTSKGKASLHNITAITQLSSKGLYKIFSNDRLDGKVLMNLFGPHHVVEYVKFWGGASGGATPDYRGRGSSVDFLLYDGAIGFDGNTVSGALYYPNAMEQSSLACMEISAIGAMAVAKLIARRLRLIMETQTKERNRDEL